MCGTWREGFQGPSKSSALESDWLPVILRLLSDCFVRSGGLQLDVLPGSLEAVFAIEAFMQHLLKQMSETLLACACATFLAVNLEVPQCCSRMESQPAFMDADRSHATRSACSKTFGPRWCFLGGEEVDVCCPE